MKVKSKLALTAATALIGMLAIFALGYASAKDGESTTDDLFGVRMARQDSFLRLQVAYNGMLRQINLAGATTHADTIDDQIRLMKRAIDGYEKNRAIGAEAMKQLDRVGVTKRGEAQLREIQRQWREFLTYGDRAIETLKSAVETSSAEEMQSAADQTFDFNMKQYEFYAKLGENLDEIIEMNRLRTEEVMRETNDRTAKFTAAQIILLLAAIGAFGAVTYSLFNTAIRPLEHARDIMREVSQSLDLRLSVNARTHDEIGEMTCAFDAMLREIRDAMGQIRDRVGKVNSEIASINELSESVAEGSHMQSAATSSMAASVEEMSVSISSVSANASDARKTARQAGENSEEGRHIVDRAQAEMRKTVEIVTQTARVIWQLGEESRQITSVVQVIKDVADQTNLLALNAAIEAARAGDQGRGFAVVADEVRKLAERTTRSVDEISAMIAKIQASSNEAVEEMDKVVRQVESGQDLTEQAGAKMRAITAQSVNVSDAIGEISNALKEQSLASQDIAKNVENIAQMTDKNNEAAHSEAQNAKTLASLSDEVKQTLERFKI